MKKKEIKVTNEKREKLIDAMMSSDREIPVAHACFTIGAAIMEMEKTKIFAPLRAKLTCDEYNGFMSELVVSLMGSVYASGFDDAKEADDALKRALEGEGTGAKA